MSTTNPRSTPGERRRLTVAAAAALLYLGSTVAANADVMGHLRVHVVAQQGTFGAAEVANSAAPADLGSAKAPRLTRKQSRPAEMPVGGAAVVLRDPVGVEPDVTIVTGRDGAALSPSLDNRTWQIVRIEAPAVPPGNAGLHPIVTGGEMTALVAADTVTDVTLALNAERDRVAHTEGVIVLVEPEQTALDFRRDRDFLRRFPVSAGNPLSLRGLLQSVPPTARPR